MKDPKFKFGRFVDYIDWGIGFKLIKGRELTTVSQFNASGNLLFTNTGEGNFSKGYVYARFAVHKLQYLNKTKNILLRMVAVFAASSLSVVGASAVAGVEPAKAIIIAGIGGVAVVIEGLARAFLRDDSLDDAEINDIFTNADKDLEK